MSVPFPLALERFPELRQTTLAAFDACPLDASWRLEYDTHDWSSYPAACGQLVHRTLARCVRHMVEHREYMIPVEVAVELFEETLRQHDVPMFSPRDDSVTPIPLRWVAEARVCVVTWAMGTQLDVEDVAGVEQRLFARVSYPDGEGGMVERVLTGRPDLLLISRDGRTLVVPDWKTSWGIPPEKPQGREDSEEVSDSGYFQQRFYGLTGFDTFPGVERVILREHYVRFATSKTQKPTREVVIEREKLPELRAEFAAMVERFDRAVQAQAWKPSPGSHCWNCVQPEKCPILPSARREGRVTSPEEAQRVAGWINVTEAALRRFRASLRPWTNVHGPVEIPDAKRERLWGPVLRTRVERPSQEEVADAVARGVDPSSLFKARTVTTFAAYSAHEAPEMVGQVAALEAQMLAAAKRAEAARKGASTRARRRRNGGN